MPSSLRRLSLAAPLALVAAILITSCQDDPSGPGYQPGFLALAPSFESSASGLVDVDSIHVHLVRDEDGTVALDTVVALDTDSETVDLSFSVLVSSSSETFTLTLECLCPTGEVVFSAGPLTVTASTSGAGDIVAEEVPLDYVGPGHNAAEVRIVTNDVVIDFGEPASLVAEALDSSGSVIEDTPIEWISHNTSRVVVPDRGAGQIVGGVERGWAHVEARLITGQSDTIDVMVEPVPSTIVVSSGNNQTAAAGATLSDSIVVQVTAVDGPMEGVTVDFATAGDGAFSPNSAVTDADGYAWTWWTLGASAGTQTATATVAGAATVQATFTAAAGGLPAGIHWTGTTDGNWSDPTRWDLGRIPTSTDTVYITVPGDGERIFVDVPATVAFLVLDGGRNLSVMSGQTLTIDSSASLGGDGYLTLDNGATLAGDGGISVDGTVRWEGGATVSGTGSLTINENGWLLLPSTTTRVLDGKSIESYGNLQWSDGDIVTTNGAIIHNYGRFHSTASAALLWDSVGTCPYLINEGVWDHTVADTTDIAVGVIFREAGSLLLFHGTLRITDGIELQDTTEITVEAVAGAPYPALVFNTTRTNYVRGDARMVVGVDGTARVEGGDLRIIGTYDQTAPRSLTEIAGGEFSPNGTVLISMLELASGNIEGGMAITALDSMYLIGGSLDAPLVVEDTAVVVIDGPVNMGNEIDNSGTVAWISGAATWSGRGINNQEGGLLLVDLASDVQVDDLNIWNYGSFVKTGSGTLRLTGPTQYEQFRGIIENFGTLDMQEGAIAIDNYFFHYDGAILQGTGTLDFTNFRLFVPGYFELSGDVLPGSSPGILHFVDSLPQDTASVFQIEIDGPVAGTGYDQIDIAGHATFNGDLNIATGLTPAVGDTFTVITFESRTGGFRNITGLDIGGGLVLDTVWEANSLSLVANAGAMPTVYWTNNAGGNWSEPTNWSTSSVPGTGDSVVIDLDGDYTVTVDQDVTIEYLTFSGGATGIQRFNITDQQLTISSFAVFGQNVVAGMFGTAMLNGACSIDINATLDWQGGTINNTGVNTVYGQLLIRGADIKTLGNGTTIENAGTVTWSTGNFSLFSGATFNNQMGAIFNVEGDNTITGDGTGAINNAGTIWKLNGTGTTRIMSTALNNAGDVSVTSGGSLSLMGGGTHTGIFSHTTGSFVDFEGGTHIVDTSLVSNGGKVRFAGGTTTVNGTYTYPEIVAFGNVNFNGPVNVSDSVLIQSANAEVYFNSPSEVQIPFARVYGSIFGSADVAITDSLRWTAGEIGTTGTFSVESGAEFRMEGAPTRNDHALTNGVTLSVAGSVFFSIANLSIDATSTVDIQPGGVFNITGLDDTISGPGSISNSGSLFKWFDAGSVTISADVVNNASLEVQTGTLVLTGDFTHSDGAVIEGTGSLDLSNPGVVTFDGDVSPGGSSPGIMTFIGPALPSGLSTAIVEIGGLTAGTEYDRVVITEDFTADGTLNVSLVNGFTPVVGNRFTVLTFASRTGDFAGYSGMDLGGGLVFEPQWDATSLDLVVTSTIQPGVTWTGGGDGASWGDPDNWTSAPSLPGVADTVYIDSDAATVTLDTDAQVLSLEVTGVGASLTQTTNTLTVDSSATIGPDAAYTITNGTLTGSGDVNVQGDLTWSGGTWTGTGTVTVEAGALLTLSGSTRSLYNGTLAIAGDAVWTAGNLYLYDNSIVSVLSGATFDIQGDANLAPGGGTPGSFSNAGTLIRSTSTGTATIGVVFTNSDVLDVQTGTTLNVAETMTHSVGAEIIGGGTLDLDTDLAVTGDASVNTLIISGALTAGTGTYSVTNTVFDGSGQLIPVLPYTNVSGAGSATFSDASPITIAGDLVVSGIADLAGANVNVEGSLSTEGTGRIGMDNAADTLNVLGSATFGGGSTNGFLTSGTLIVSGNFTQSGNASSFAASGSHTTLFNGSATQNVDFASPDSSTTGSHFSRLLISQSEGPLTLNTPVFADSARIDDFNSSAALVVDGTGELILRGDLVLQEDNYGLEVSPAAVRLGGSLGMMGTFQPSVTEFFGGTASVAQTIPINYNYQSILVSGDSVKLANIATYSIAGDLTVAGTGLLDVDSVDITVGGNLITQDQGRLRMDVSIGSVIVTGNATFGGGSTDGLLTSSSLTVGGDFTQSSANSTRSFAPLDGHVTVFNGSAEQRVYFDDPASTSSFFDDLRVENSSGAGIVLDTDVFVYHRFLTPTDATTRYLYGQGNSIVAHAMDIEYVEFDDLPLDIAYDGDYSSVTDMWQTTFQNMTDGVTQFTLTRASGGPGFSSISFDDSVTGLFAHVTDANGGSDLTVNFDCPYPADLTGRVLEDNTASVTWSCP